MVLPWNALPHYIRNGSSVDIFKFRLKKHTCLDYHMTDSLLLVFVKQYFVNELKLISCLKNDGQGVT